MWKRREGVSLTIGEGASASAAAVACAASTCCSTGPGKPPPGNLTCHLCSGFRFGGNSECSWAGRRLQAAVSAEEVVVEGKEEEPQTLI